MRIVILWQTKRLHMKPDDRPIDAKQFLQGLVESGEAENRGSVGARQAHYRKFLGELADQERANQVLVRCLRAVEPEFLSDLVRRGNSSLGPILSSLLCLHACARGHSSSGLSANLKLVYYLYWPCSGGEPKKITDEFAFRAIRDGLLNHPEVRFGEMARLVMEWPVSSGPGDEGGTR